MADCVVACSSVVVHTEVGFVFSKDRWSCLFEEEIAKEAEETGQRKGREG